MLRVLLVVGTLASPLPALSASFLTFEINVHAPCPSQTDVCGFSSEYEFVKALDAAIDVVNAIWRPTGRVFKSGLVTFHYGHELATINAFDRSLTPEDVAANGRKIEKFVSANPPSQYTGIQLVMVPALSGGFSAIPCADDNILVPCRPGQKRSYDAAWRALFSCCLDGRLLAHELAHHFRVSHPFTGLDAEEVTDPALVSHDGDGLADTPPDPGPAEGIFEDEHQALKAAEQVGFDRLFAGKAKDAVPGKAPVIASKRAGHTWCEWLETPADAGSPFSPLCVADCQETDAAGVQEDTTNAPNLQLAVSYSRTCASGPWCMAASASRPSPRAR